MQGVDLCLVYAPIIAIVVNVLKRIPFVGKNPAVVATVLASVLNVAGVLIHGGIGNINAQIVQCVLTSLGGSIVAYHAAVKPITNAVTK